MAEPWLPERMLQDVSAENRERLVALQVCRWEITAHQLGEILKKFPEDARIVAYSVQDYGREYGFAIWSMRFKPCLQTKAIPKVFVTLHDLKSGPDSVEIDLKPYLED